MERAVEVTVANVFSALLDVVPARLNNYPAEDCAVLNQLDGSVGDSWNVSPILYAPVGSAVRLHLVAATVFRQRPERASD